MSESGLRKMLCDDEVLAIIPISRSTLWRMEQVGQFPRSTYISPGRRVWFLDEIVLWQNTVSELQPGRRRGRGKARAKQPAATAA